jgi:DNA polymerase/3'-5' exonuclease PolX
MAKTKLSLAQAQPLAEKIRDTLKPYCERIEIAGSIRRQRPMVGDIEIVCIPRCQTDLFGNPGASLLPWFLGELVNESRLLPGDKNGEKYKEYYIPAIDGLKLDLFITSPECWSVIFAIRTGSASFSRRLVTQKEKGGWLPSHLQVKGGRIWDGNELVNLATERDFLELCGGWVEPTERN